MQDGSARERLNTVNTGELAMTVTKQQEKQIKQMVRKCMNHLKKKDYELDINKADVDHALRVTRVVHKNRNGATYGGRHVIQSTQLLAAQEGAHVPENTMRSTSVP